MAIALIIAAGSGHRANQEIPKQFLTIKEKPILIYTLEAFQHHPSITEIEVVCLDGWQDILWAYARQFNITKLKWVVKGGSTGQESIRNGIENLAGKIKEQEIVIIHDGVRPLIDDYILSDLVVKCEKYGNAVTSLPYNEQIFIKTDEETTNKYINRDTLKRVQTPQAYVYEKIRWAYKEGFERNIGISGSSYANTLMVDLGETLYFAAGSDRNIKITTPEDISLFKAYLEMEKNS